ncbi:MAG: ATP synthase F1 subunit gamma [Deltaproteobacteria bacterium CG11_big_fil_rev_8_21_14_0_20_49_13]|nr:MAG: ATP synthase F1 subunit gamma [Deltaproteobacteria bacterium CG11_big_fil_rev_8_21_14_0_20_49_13]
MATLKSIRKRIISTQSTKKLTHAMKMIASSRMRKAQQRVCTARAYNKELRRILLEIVKEQKEISSFLLNPQEDEKGIVNIFVISSDRGLCGTFNEHLLKKVRATLDKRYRIFVIGKKGRDFFRRNGIEIEKVCAQPDLSKEMNLAIERYRKGEIDEAYIAYNKFQSLGSIEPSIERILPVDLGDFMPVLSVDHICEPGAEEVIERAIKRTMETGFLLAYLESSAAELSARMIAMEMATKNADDLIISLTQVYNKARQATITRDLIDIVGGAEALKR